jgi:hypothetical protein
MSHPNPNFDPENVKEEDVFDVLFWNGKSADDIDSHQDTEPDLQRMVREGERQHLERLQENFGSGLI